jgi:hypothetical protein
VQTRQVTLLSLLPFAGAADAVLDAYDFARCYRPVWLTDRALAWVPAGGDLYVLSRVLQHWGDAVALRILANCRRAMASDARLVVIEPVLTLPAVTTIRGTQERTEAQLAALLAVAGFTITGILPTASRLSIIEARPSQNFDCGQPNTY